MKMALSAQHTRHFQVSGAKTNSQIRRSSHSARHRARCTTVAQARRVEKFPKWNIVWNYLVKQNLESISPELANQLVASDEWVLVDVRPPASYEKAHISGAVACPIYQPLDMSKPNFQTYLKFAMYAANGVSPIEMNPTFTEDIAKVASSGKGVILYCEAGGTMKPSPNFECGKASRSLQAAFRTILEELSPAAKVKHLDGGIYGWYQADLPIDGDYDASDVGRTPNAAAVPTGLRQ